MIAILWQQFGSSRFWLLVVVGCYTSFPFVFHPPCLSPPQCSTSALLRKGQL
ncbi:unnamed protein product [Heterosigma akashiwo]